MIRISLIFGAMALLSVSAASLAQQTPQAQETANVPEPGGQEAIALFKDRRSLVTVSCRDFNLLDESYRPQAVVYGANYGPKGKAHPTMTVDGVVNIVPVVVDACRARPGNHFTTAVRAAMAAAR